MMKSEQLAERLGKAVQSWLNDESGALQMAIDKTVNEGLFFREDVMRALGHTRTSVTAELLQKWVKESVHEKPDISNKDIVLCLHAGNLPLVGLQDVLAVLLSGHEYAGKISRKDPYLMKSLLDHLEKDGSFPKMRYSTNLEDFVNLGAGAVMFSGSEESVPEVRAVLSEHNIMAAGAKELIRTAHSSVAWIGKEAETDTIIRALLEAIFAYEGKGCRSLITIFTDGDARHLLDAIAREAGASPYIQNCISPKALSPVLHYKRSFYSAVDQPYLRLGDKLIVIGEPDPRTEGLITITQSEGKECINFIKKQNAKIQSFYTVEETPGLGEIPVESLHHAQSPPVNWKPDGTDPLKWLTELEQTSGTMV